MSPDTGNTGYTDNTVFTIGHSNLSLEQFIRNLKSNTISHCVDVRSYPYSSRLPHFNANHLSQSLAKANIPYHFMGKTLGGRPSDQTLYDPQGIVDYNAIADQPAFHTTMDQLVRAAPRMRLVLICTEQDPIHCHRTLLLANALHQRGVQIKHILKNGGTETHQRVIARILAATGLRVNAGAPPQETQQLIQQAFDAQSKKVAYRQR